MSEAHAGDLISAWLDGELEEAEMAALAEHLEQCPACELERDEVAAARQALRGLPLLDPTPADLQPRPALHLGDALSAWLDGELDEEELNGAAAHLDTCPACSAELAEVAAARAMLRGLPMPEVPLGSLRPPAGQLIQHPRRPRIRRTAALAGVAAVAAGVVGLVSTAEPLAAEQPAMAELVAEHRRAVTPVPQLERLSLGQTQSRRAPAGRASASMLGPPAALNPGYVLVDVRLGEGALHASYSDGDHTLSLFSHLSGPRLGGAPGPGDPVALGGTEGRYWDSEDRHVLAWADRGVAYVIVTDGSTDDAVAAAQSVPGTRDSSALERARRRSRGVVHLIG